VVHPRLQLVGATLRTRVAISIDLRRMRQLEEENRKLKQIVADLSLDKATLLQAVVSKKSEAFAAA
jgi:hypothetical protein